MGIAETIAGAASISRGRIRVGPYRVVRVLGRGGMGTVYQAEVLENGPLPPGAMVAIKVLRRVEREEIRRFTREVSYLRALRHPGIVQILDAGESHGRPYLVMQLLAGRMLDDVVAEARRLGRPGLDQRQAAEMCVQALEALHVAHLAGILHRDLKPGNILLGEDGQIRLLDFGLAMSIDRESGLTRSDAVVGTPAYMSPEQAEGTRADLSRRTDIYGMGACLYELLTLRQPFTGENQIAVLRRIVSGPLAPPSAHRRDLDRGLERIVLAAMARQPRDRYATAEAMAADLRRFLRGERVRGRPPGRTRLAARWLWQRRMAAATIGLLLFVPVSAIVLSLRAAQRPPPAPAGAEWIGEWRLPGPAPAADAPAAGKLAPLGTLVPDPALPPGTLLAKLPPVPGAARLTAWVETAAAGARVEMALGDPDIGQGYRLRLDADGAGARLALLRARQTVASTPVSLPAGAIGLRFTATEGDVRGEVAERAAETGWREVVRFTDLVPIASPDAVEVWVAATAGSATIADLALERQRAPLVSSPLAQADFLRQNGRWNRALRLYEQFLRDRPDAPEAADARLRAALCLSELGDVEAALGRFAALAADAANDPRYRLAATVYAWSCAIRLGRYEEADAYLAEVRDGFSLPTILGTVSETTVADLLRDYLARTDRLAASDPLRAADLAATAADFADHIGAASVLARARLAAGDLAAAAGDYDEAVAQYRLARDDGRLASAVRRQAMISIGHCERLRGRPDAAQSAYAAVLGDDELGQWALLWAGDLALERQGAAAAQEIWRRSPESRTLPGRIMRLLADDPTEPAEFAGGREQRAAIAYWQARARMIAGDEDGYQAGLAVAAQSGAPHDPVALLARGLRERSGGAAP